MTRRPRIMAPAHSCDCHAHVCGPEARYPYAERRLHTPADASPLEFREMLDVLGVERGVLVQPSVYGSDNQALKDALSTDPVRRRGVATLPSEVRVSEVERLHSLGVRGVRCNIVDLVDGAGILPLDRLRRLAATVKPFGWHLELLMHVDEFPDLDVQLGSLSVPVVFGHLGYVPTHRWPCEGFQAMLRLMKDGKAWAKITAPYRLTGEEFPYAAADEMTQELVETVSERLLWGTDWPHVYIRSGMPDDGDLFDWFATRVSSASALQSILVANPAQLYGF
jgi:2-pyrone-4,6-dicarboxylate lactonase